MSRPLTAEDFEAVRDVEDGHRYELITGSLIVTPTPFPIHQLALGELLMLLHDLVPPGQHLYPGPLDIRLDEDTIVQPDLLIASDESTTSQRIEGPPVLAVEVLSPSTRHIDLGLKLSVYEAYATPHYWVVDPHEPSLRAWDMGEEGRYVQAAHVVGDEVASLFLPWPVEVTPGGLVRKLR